MSLWWIPLLGCPIALIGTSTTTVRAFAEPSGGFTSSNRQSEFYDTLPGGDKGSIFDATNPMDLINRLKRATAMDDATSPSDAVDKALKALDAVVMESSKKE